MTRYDPGTRGAYAATPAEIPRRGWWQALKRVQKNIAPDHISLASAGVSFYGFLALFPTLSALVMIYGLVATAADAERHISLIRGVVPGEAFDIIRSQVRGVAGSDQTGLALGAVFSLLLAIWSGTKGTKALMTAMNIAYEEREKRGLLFQNVLAVALTTGGVLVVLCSLFAIAAIPAIVSFVGEGWVGLLVLTLRWLVMFAVLMGGLAILYRWGPSRAAARLAWLTPGAFLATILWLVASVAFSYYVQNFGNYNEVFGSLGAVVILLLWFYISAFVVCLGAALNAELERQTYRDSTAGRDRPMGRRGAVVADTAIES